MQKDESLLIEQQVTDTLMMIQPVRFGFNEQTAASNTFQQATNHTDLQQRALAEFNAFVALLRSEGLQIIVIEDTIEPYTPDSIFPNNWISLHSDGTLLLYPMYAPNRRLERRGDVIRSLGEQYGFTTIDLSFHEQAGIFLEGTGSMVLDRVHRIAYACLSDRTYPDILKEFAERMRYDIVSFQTEHPSGVAIYHTNVVMAVGERMAVVCLDIMTEPGRRVVVERLEATEHTILPITLGQLNAFAGNMLQARNTAHELLWIMSSRAYNALTLQQRSQLTEDARIVHAPLDTIETAGGGSARCMLAEIHFPSL